MVLPVGNKNRGTVTTPPSGGTIVIGGDGVQIPVQVPLATPVGVAVNVPTPVGVPNYIEVPEPTPVGVAVEVPVPTPVNVAVQVNVPTETVEVEVQSHVAPSNILLGYMGDTDLGRPIAEYSAAWMHTQTYHEDGDSISSWVDPCNGYNLTAFANGTFRYDSDGMPYIECGTSSGFYTTALGSQLNSSGDQGYTIALVFSLNALALDKRFVQVGATSGNAQLYWGTDTSLNVDNQIILRTGSISDGAGSVSHGQSNSFQSQTILETGKKYIGIITGNGENHWLYLASHRGYPRLICLGEDCQTRTHSKFSLGCGMTTSGNIDKSPDINIYHCAVYNRCMYTPIETMVSLAHMWRIELGDIPQARVRRRPTFAYVFRPQQSTHVDIMNSGQNFYERDNSGSGNFFKSVGTAYSGADDEAIYYDLATGSSTARCQIDLANTASQWLANDGLPRSFAIRVQTPNSWGTNNRCILSVGESSGDHWRVFFDTNGKLVMQYAHSSGAVTITGVPYYYNRVWYTIYGGFYGTSVWLRQGLEAIDTNTSASLATPPATAVKNVYLFNTGTFNQLFDGGLHWLAYWHNYQLTDEDMNIIQTARFHGSVGGGVQSSLPAELV